MGFRSIDKSTILKGIGIGTAIVVLTGGLLDACLKLKSNKKLVDLTKSFNAALEETDTGVSITYINEYYDFKNNQIQFLTQDNLLIYTSTNDIQLINQPSNTIIKEYASSISDSEDTVLVYDELQGLDYPTEYEHNKSFAELNKDYNYNYAICQVKLHFITD